MAPSYFLPLNRYPVKTKVHIDVETYSSVDIRKAGAYAYTESLDFEILLIAFAYDDGPVRVVDMAQGEEIPGELLRALTDKDITKVAHNATFERLAFRAIGFPTNPEEWECSAVLSSYCGLPLSLEDVSKALKLGELGKKETGKALIKYFCVPCKPTKTNGGRERNLPQHDPEKWESFKEYVEYDVIAEREICDRLQGFEIPEEERLLYCVDQRINDRGVKVDLELAAKAVALDTEHKTRTIKAAKELTGLANPNSPAHLKKWLSDKIGEEVKSLAKEHLPALLAHPKADGAIRELVRLRGLLAKTSVKKYAAMLDSAGEGSRVRGLLKFYGASRTGRWAGRLVQIQNLPKDNLANLTLDREVTKGADYDTLDFAYGNVASLLSQLIRTAFVAPEGKTFAVADFSAIEARVIAWLTGEKWRLEVFKTHGKIYEASAAKMFGVPIESVTKGSDYRARGKVAELALGYQGGVGALKAMGGERMGLDESEMSEIVKMWREANPAIAKFWREIERYAINAIRTGKTVTLSKYRGLKLGRVGRTFFIELPSGRRLHYHNVTLAPGIFGEAIRYEGKDTYGWARLDTYGGKLTENIVQAIARDLLAHALIQLDDKGYDTVLHVHDEVGVEVDEHRATEELESIVSLMTCAPSWAADLPLAADGYTTPFYKKD